MFKSSLDYLFLYLFIGLGKKINFSYTINIPWDSTTLIIQKPFYYYKIAVFISKKTHIKV